MEASQPRPTCFRFFVYCAENALFFFSFYLNLSYRHWSQKSSLPVFPHIAERCLNSGVTPYFPQQGNSCPPSVCQCSVVRVPIGLSHRFIGARLVCRKTDAFIRKISTQSCTTYSLCFKMSEPFGTKASIILRL